MTGLCIYISFCGFEIVVFVVLRMKEYRTQYFQITSEKDLNEKKAKRISYNENDNEKLKYHKGTRRKENT